MLNFKIVKSAALRAIMAKLCIKDTLSQLFQRYMVITIILIPVFVELFLKL
jgi:hypothetical protein